MTIKIEYFSDVLCICAFRDAFFHHGRNISNCAVQDEIAEEPQLPLNNIREYIDTGQTHAALHQDDEVKNNYKMLGSPALVLNKERLLLYGNVGYQIIDANFRALLRNSDHGDASWC